MDQEKRYEDIAKLIKEYNEFAISKNSNVRLGIASSRLYRDDDDHDDDENQDNKVLTHEEFIKEIGYYDNNTSISIHAFGTDAGWFPSSIC